MTQESDVSSYAPKAESRQLGGIHLMGLKESNLETCQCDSNHLEFTVAQTLDSEEDLSLDREHTHDIKMELPDVQMIRLPSLKSFLPEISAVKTFRQ